MKLFHRSSKGSKSGISAGVMLGLALFSAWGHSAHADPLSSCQYAEIPKGIIAGDNTALATLPSDRHALNGFLQAHGQTNLKWFPCRNRNKVFGTTISAGPVSGRPDDLRLFVSGSGGDGFLDDLVMHASSVTIPNTGEFLIHTPFQTHDGKEIIVSGAP